MHEEWVEAHEVLLEGGVKPIEGLAWQRWLILSVLTMNPQKGKWQMDPTASSVRQSSCFDEFAFSSRNRASGASLTCIYSPLSYLSCQVFGQRDAEEIPRGPRGTSCTRALCLWALMLPIVQAAEKSIALLKSSPDVTTSLASGVSRSFISVHATAGE